MIGVALAEDQTDLVTSSSHGPRWNGRLPPASRSGVGDDRVVRRLCVSSRRRFVPRAGAPDKRTVGPFEELSVFGSYSTTVSNSLGALSNLGGSNPVGSEASNSVGSRELCCHGPFEWS